MLAAVLVGWFGVYLAYQGSAIGLVLLPADDNPRGLSLRRGRALAGQQREQLRIAFEAAQARNRELDSLGHLAATLLTGSDLQVLFHEVAKAAADLIEADAGAITLVVEEGRFLKIVAATGPMKDMTGSLLPVEQLPARLGGGGGTAAPLRGHGSGSPQFRPAAGHRRA